MGDFLVVIPKRKGSQASALSFSHGVLNFRSLFSWAEPLRYEADWAYATVVPRLNGSGGDIIHHAETQSWMVVHGTWYAPDGLGSGHEQKLLKRFMVDGVPRTAQKLEGFFAIVLADGRSKTVHIITDIVGSCHAYLRDFETHLAVSTSSLALAGLDETQTDSLACHEFLHTGVMYEDRTFYRQVRKIPPASILRCGENSCEATTYWDLSALSPNSLSGEDAVDSFFNQLVSAGEKVAKLYRRPICDLTGGYDSRALVTGLLNARTPFTTTVTGDDVSPDVIVSKEIAREFSLEHKQIHPPHISSWNEIAQALPFTDGEINLLDYVQTLAVHRQLSMTGEVSLNGSFGEVARGYWWELLSPHTGKIRAIDTELIARRRYVLSQSDQQLCEGNLLEHFARMLNISCDKISHFPNTSKMDHIYLRFRMQRWQGRIASSTNRLWPCLSPFIFRPVLECMLQIDWKLRKHSFIVRRMFETHLPRIAKIPLEHGWPAVPFRVTNCLSFLPLARFWGDKALRKIAKNVGAPTNSANSLYAEMRLRLWQDEQIRDGILRGEMRVQSVTHEDGLKKFLINSKEPGFKFDEQWGRLLTLEYTLREVEQLRRSAALSR